MAKPKPPSRRESKKTTTRDKLLRSALRLFRKRGFNAVTISDITNAAGTAKGTFFNYFNTKADVIAVWYKTASLPTDDAKIETLAEALDLVVYKPLDELLSEPELLAAKFANENDNASIAEAEAEVDKRISTILEAVLLKEEEKAGPLPVTAGELASLIGAILTGAAREWRISGEKRALSAIAKERLDSLFALADEARLTKGPAQD